MSNRDPGASGPEEPEEPEGPETPEEPDGRQDPEDPGRTPGLEPGGSVPPGETPPGEDSTSGAGPRDTHNPPRGWARTPLVVLSLVVAVFVVYFLVWALKL